MQTQTAPPPTRRLIHNTYHLFLEVQSPSLNWCNPTLSEPAGAKLHFILAGEDFWISEQITGVVFAPLLKTRF